jgi:4-carboxymuconolactone decarboxylase
MKDIHEVFTRFKEDFPELSASYEALGNEIHEKAGPLSGKVRWLLKVAISGASGHKLALETHIVRAREAGATDEEIVHALLLLIQTTGFPTFMEAYSVFRGLR